MASQVKVGYTGRGIVSKGITFVRGEFYVVSEEVGKYLTSTFPDDFNIIERIAEKKPTKEPAKKPTRRKAKPKTSKEEDKEV